MRPAEAIPKRRVLTLQTLTVKTAEAEVFEKADLNRESADTTNALTTVETPTQNGQLPLRRKGTR